MTEPSLERAVRESMEDVLEKMFFIQCLGEAEGDVAAGEVVAHMVFEGDPSGSLTLSVTSGAARSVAADFLGEEGPDLSDGQIGDVVCELANMICGSVLSRVESTTTFRLATPQIIVSRNDVGSPAAEAPATEASPPPTAGPASFAGHVVDISKGRMEVVIRTETPVWALAEKSAF